MTYTRFGLRVFRHGNSCISKVSIRFFSECPIDTKIILNESLDQHDQNDMSCTQIRPQTRKLSLIEVLTFQVRVSLIGHAYIGLYLTHACQKHFWKGRKTDFSSHARSQLHGQKRQFEKVTQKKCFKKPQNTMSASIVIFKHSARRHFNFSK